MKIHILEDPGAEDLEITIHFNKLDDRIEKLISMLRIMDMKLTVKRDKEMFILDAGKVLYIDTADKKTFVYTREEVFESDLRLYELEERLAAVNFLRANKSCIINFNGIKAIKADLDGKLLITMRNGEQLFVSKQYAGDFKKKLEGKS